MSPDVDRVLTEHCAMIRRVDPSLWSEVCWSEKIGGARKRAKAERRVGRKVRAFVARHDPANNDVDAKRRDAVFDAFIMRSATLADVAAARVPVVALHSCQACGRHPDTHAATGDERCPMCGLGDEREAKS